MKYVCTVCGWEYDESAGYPEGGIAPTSYRQIEVSGWCEMIGSNLTSGKTTWIYNYIVQS